MRSFLKNNWFVLIVYFFFLILASYSILTNDKVALHIQLNQLVGNPFLDPFFYYITYLGDGIMAIFLLLIIVLINIRLGIYATITFATASLFSQFLKRYMYDDVMRPHHVFQSVQNYTLNLVEGVDSHIHNSFPSGHATQVFAIFMCLVFVIRNKLLKILLLLFALLGAYSRVHLSQHWLNDVTAGSVIGFVFSLIFYFILIYKNRLEKLNRPVFLSAKKDAKN